MKAAKITTPEEQIRLAEDLINSNNKTVTGKVISALLDSLTENVICGNCKMNAQAYYEIVACERCNRMTVLESCQKKGKLEFYDTHIR